MKPLVIKKIFPGFLTFVMGVSLILTPGCEKDPGEGLFAQLHTREGVILVRLLPEQAPLAVSSFVGLAEGKLPFLDPLTGKKATRPYFDKTVFFRAHHGVSVQGGDPLGDGSGGPGFKLPIEKGGAVRFDAPGRVALVNHRATADGGMFIITLKKQNFLNDRHTLFGTVAQGLNLAKKLITGSPLQKVTILRKGKKALAYDPMALFSTLKSAALGAVEAEKKAGREVPHTKFTVFKDNPKDIPEPKGAPDPRRVPRKGQKSITRGAFQFISIAFKGSKNKNIGNPLYTQAQALELAKKLVRLARTKGADFLKLAFKFSDEKGKSFPLLVKNEQTPAFFLPAFSLEEGQVSDPVVSSYGVVIFHRIPLVTGHFAHIVITHNQSKTQKPTDRSPKEAKEFAEGLKKRLDEGAYFDELARGFSEAPTARNGGTLGEVARGQTEPGFDGAAFALKPGEVSDVVTTSMGFQIIKRLK